MAITDMIIMLQYAKKTLDTAKSALRRKGNPSYDQSIYLNDDVWKLKK